MPRPRPAALQRRRLARARELVAARFGPHVLRRLDAARPEKDVQSVPSGSLGLDLTLGGGLPRGRLTELLGPPSSGKTALLYSAIAQTQRAGGIAALVDAEGSADGEALLACGVDLDALLLVRPAHAADALLMLTILTRCGGLDLLGLISIPALRDLALPGGQTAPHLEGLAVARLLSRALRVLMAALRDVPTAVVLVNETVPRLPGHRTPGGLALRHYAGLRIAVDPRPVPTLSGAGEALRADLVVIKNKCGTFGGHATIDVGAAGVDRPAEMLALGLAAGLVERGPLGLLHGRDVLGKSDGAARRNLAADPALADALAAAILAAGERPAAA